MCVQFLLVLPCYFTRNTTKLRNSEPETKTDFNPSSGGANGSENKLNVTFIHLKLGETERV